MQINTNLQNNNDKNSESTSPESEFTDLTELFTLNEVLDNIKIFNSTVYIYI